MQSINDKQMRLASKIATEIEGSSCDVEQCVNVLIALAAGLVGRHVPDEEQYNIMKTIVQKRFELALSHFFHESDLYPGR